MRSQAPALFSPWLVATAGLLSLAVAMGIGRFAFTPVLPLALGEGLLNVEQGGWIAAANYVGYLVGALTATRMPLRSGTLAVLGLIATAALTAAMAWPASALWLPLRFLAGAASAWVFVATSVWCLGALSTLGTIMMVLTFMGFTLPPECACYWVGEVGQPPAKDREKRLANDASKHMAKNLARNTLYYAQLLKERPLLAEPVPAHA